MSEYLDDTGCELSPSCLRCPLVRCKYDEPKASRAEVAAAKDMTQVARAASLREEGLKVAQIAEEMHLSKRTIHRLLKVSGGVSD